MGYYRKNGHTEEAARELGFVEVPHELGHNGRSVFMRDGLKWIYNINGLKKDLGVNSDMQLVNLGYDVKTYRDMMTIHDLNTKELRDLFQDLDNSGAVLGGRVYLEGGLWLYPDGTIA